MTEKATICRSVHDKLEVIFSDNPVKRFNLGFGVIGVPEQNKDGKYCEYAEAAQIFLKLRSLILAEENKVWELETHKIPALKAHYRRRIAVAVFGLFPLGYLLGRFVS